MSEHKKKRINLLWPVLGGVALIGLVVAIVFAAIAMGRELTLTLKGETQLTLEFGESYIEPGFSASYGDTDMTADVQVTGQVDDTKLGTYTVTYSLQRKDETVTQQRTVRIVDTQAPTIVLIHNREGFTLPGHEYVEEGFVAEDNYDGDITASVQRMQEGDEIIYQVFDSSGNRAEVRRTIKYNDITAPVLTLLGDETVRIIAGGNYTEPGYTAIDDAEGDITSKVVVSGVYDLTTAGEYTVTYTVTDNYGNTATATRTIKVIQKSYTNTPSNPVDGHVIYLTFDDGPSQHTPRLLEILAKYDVKATFFVVGTAATGYFDDIVAGGHSIALHANNHDYNKIYASEDAYFEDLYAIQDKVHEQTGVYTYLMRFPGGSSNTASGYNPGIMTKLTQAVQDKGFYYFDWNVDSKDAGGAKTADEVFNNVIKGVQNHEQSVVLQHDIWGYSVDAVERIIQWGLANGYVFAALSESSPGAHHPVNN